MTRQEQIIDYANSFKGYGIENEELKETIRMAVIDGALFADAHPDEGLVSIDKVCEYLANHIDKGLVIYNDNTWLKRDEFIEKLKKEINK